MKSASAGGATGWNNIAWKMSRPASPARGTRQVAGDDSVRFQLAQLFREHYLGGSGNLPAQLGQSPRALAHPRKDHGLPLPAKSVEAKVEDPQPRE
jgi:hypothetical protein